MLSGSRGLGTTTIGDTQGVGVFRGSSHMSSSYSCLIAASTCGLVEKGTRLRFYAQVPLYHQYSVVAENSSVFLARGILNQNHVQFYLSHLILNLL